MITYKDFYKITKYASVNWRGNFTQEEIAENSHILKCDYDYSIQQKYPTDSIVSLCEQICDDMTIVIDDCLCMEDVDNVISAFLVYIG